MKEQDGYRTRRAMCEVFARCGDADEDGCLASYAEAELEGIALHSPACVRCVREEHSCDSVVGFCSDLCEFE